MGCVDSPGVGEGLPGATLLELGITHMTYSSIKKKKYFKRWFTVHWEFQRNSQEQHPSSLKGPGVETTVTVPLASKISGVESRHTLKHCLHT